MTPDRIRLASAVSVRMTIPSLAGVEQDAGEPTDAVDLHQAGSTGADGRACRRLCTVGKEARRRR